MLRKHAQHRSQARPARPLAVAVVVCCLAIATFLAATFWPGHPPTSHADALVNGLQSSASRFGEIARGSQPGRQPAAAAKPVAARRRAGAGGGAGAPVYQNPLRDITGLIPERIDMGVDFGGTGSVFALGDGVVTMASDDNPGWPGGGWITYRLSDGPAAGLVVYVAEDVRPAVAPGRHLTPATVVGTMFDGGAGIETGWAQPDGSSAESELPAAGAIGGNGPFPTKVGVSFDRLLQALGVHQASNYGQPGHGNLPAGYRAHWTGLPAKR